MFRLPKSLRLFGLFGGSVLLTKGMSLVTIPLVTGHLTPADYGQLELVTSIIEAFAIVLTLGVADSLFRFAGDVEGSEQKQVAAGLVGTTLTLAFAIGLALQLAVLTLAPRFGLESVQTPLAIGMAAATLSALIELPLAWLRLRGRAGGFFIFTVGRTMLQVATMAITLNAGYGVVGLLAGNATIDALIAAVLLGLQIRECGIRLDTVTFARAGRYSMPLIGGSLSMFVLGSCDRWFLAGAVPRAELGFYGLAVKLSQIAPLVIQPFGLWWYARRIAVLREPGGLEASARGVSIGMMLLAAGAAVACFGAPLLVNGLLPNAYRAALPYLPWLVLASALNETCSLTNVGAYAGRHAYQVLGVNTAGAAVALIGYIFLTHPYGVWGAIISTLAGHVVRMTLYVVLGRRDAPIRYPWGLALTLLTLVALVFCGIQIAPTIISAAAIAFVGIVVFVALLWRVGRREISALLSGQGI